MAAPDGLEIFDAVLVNQILWPVPRRTVVVKRRFRCDMRKKWILLVVHKLGCRVMIRLPHSAVPGEGWRPMIAACRRVLAAARDQALTIDGPASGLGATGWPRFTGVLRMRTRGRSGHLHARVFEDYLLKLTVPIANPSQDNPSQDKPFAVDPQVEIVG